jgi:hypothetical protein
MDFDTLISTCYSFYNERQSLFKLASTPEEQIQLQKENLHFFRVHLEPYVFNYLNYTYGKQLDTHWLTHKFPKKNKYAFVIIERRPHPNWWFILRNIAWAAPHFSLYIFGRDLNYDFIKTLLGDKAENVHIHQFYKGVADREKGYYESNLTLQMPQFYRLIDAEYFINVHMDAYFIQKIPDWIFTGTYYGSPWGWDPDRAGNGGLAVRNTKKLIDLCEKEINNVFSKCGEDCYLTDAIIKHNHYLPPLEFRMKVFQENFPTQFIPIGTHQFWTYLTNYNISNKSNFIDNIKKLITIIDL